MFSRSLGLLNRFSHHLHAARRRKQAGPYHHPELLERRTLLAGNVLVYWSGKDLVIKGDDASNAIEILKQPVIFINDPNLTASADVSLRDRVSVRDLNGNTINGESTEFVAQARSESDSRVKGMGLRVMLGSGDDSVRVRANGDDANFKSLQIIGGEGNDSIVLTERMGVTGSLIINAGSGDNNITLDGSSFFPFPWDQELKIGQQLTIQSGAGEDDVRLVNVTVGGRTVITTGSGDDHVHVSKFRGFFALDAGFEDDAIDIGNILPVFPSPVRHVDFRGGVRIQTGPGDDHIDVDNITFGGASRIDAGTGDDHIKISRAQMKSHLTIKTDLGDDRLSVSGAEMEGALRILNGPGDDHIDVDNITFGGASRIDAGFGDDVIRIGHGTFKSHASISGGAGDDLLSLLDSVFSGDVMLSAGSGDDVDNVQRSTFEKGTLINTDRGNDVLKTDNSRFNGPTEFLMGTGQDTMNLGVRTRFSPRFPLQTGKLSLTANFFNKGPTGSAGLVVTRSSKVPLTGSLTGMSTPGATVSVDTDQDGLFDDGRVKVGRDGRYKIPVRLQRTVADAGEKTIRVKTTLNGDAEIRTVDMYVAVGSVVQFRTNVGSFDVELFDKDAPHTVVNFLNYVSAGSYDNLLVHRSVENFVVHTGGFSVSNGRISTVVADPTIPNEFLAKNSNLRGTLSMAHPGFPDGASSQWFVNVDDDNRWSLDSHKHTVFGRVIGDGMAVIDRINKMQSFDLSSLYTDVQLGEVPLKRPLTNGSVIPGKVSVRAGSRSVTGVGTHFNRDLTVGDSLLIDGQRYLVASIQSNTALKLKSQVRQTASNVVARMNVGPAPDDFVVFSDIRKIL
jgi:cyclophilin family peptidyl-prolyl cis-trans isomerase